MIERVTVQHFKRFESQSFELADTIVLAGPNNSGKTTLLQAIATWNLALQKWKEKLSGTSIKRRSGVPITRKDFTALPLREMNLLWSNRSTNITKHDIDDGRKPGASRTMSICLEGKTNGASWCLPFEFTFQNSELVYAKPSAEFIEELPKAAEGFQVVHVPPFSGIGAEETRYDKPYQDLLIGQGKAGDIVRNLLFELYEKHRLTGDTGWQKLNEEIQAIFGYSLLPPEYEGKPFILCEYLPGTPARKGRDGLPALDIASAGSGFHQTLLLMGFFFARPSSVLLLDEPDAHLHVILQKQVFDKLKSLAARNKAQLVVATHSEVIVDSTSPSKILSFYDRPHILGSETERQQVREALKRLSSLDVLSLESSPGVLYVEGESDFDLLRSWAVALDHPVAEWFVKEPFWRNNQGRNPREARDHFFALKAVRPDIRGFLLLDGDNRGMPDHEISGEGLVIGRWQRYEIENYLFHPAALLRFVDDFGPLFRNSAERYLKDQTPPVVFTHPEIDHPFLANTPFSKTFLPSFFDACQIRIPKNEYYRVAETMDPDEIHGEVKDMLDLIQTSLGISL